MERWNGKVAVVTGASSGIGAAIAQKLVEAGMKVVGLDRQAERIEEQAKTYVGKPGKLYAFKTNLTVERDILKAIKWTTDNVGFVHILVNCAGVITQGSLTNAETEKLKQTLDTNVLGLCIVTREAIQVMKRNNIDGHIIHLNSIAGHKLLYIPNTNLYSATKYAITNLAGILRQELTAESSGIKVTSLSPGTVDTPMIGALSPDISELINNMPKLKPEDVANAAIFALSTPPSVQISELSMNALGETL